MTIPEQRPLATIQTFEGKNKKTLDILFFLILALGIGLRFYQYLMGRSLWEDEAHFALNFITRDYKGILKPLDYIQAAPPLFLLTVKTFTLIGGNSANALRALPFLSSIITLPLFYYILRSLTKSKIAALAGFLAFSVNIAVIYFSSELKTYGIDVAVYLLLIYLVLSKHPVVVKRKNLWLGVAGCASLLYSNVAFIILFCIACNMLLKWFQSKKIDKAEVKVLASWAIIFIAYYFLFVYHHPYEGIQRHNYSFGFPPLPLFGHEFNEFMKTSIHNIAFGNLLYVSGSYGFAYVLLFLTLLAIGHAIYRKQYTLLLFTCLPVLIHFTLAIFKIYPFWYRLILYLVPPLMILMISGLSITINFITRKLHWVAGVIIAIICSYFFTEPSFKQYPLYYREIKPVLDLINKDYPRSNLYVTTPYTLYKYYNLRGYAKNDLYEGLDWYNRSMPPETYYKAVEGATSNYILLHAHDPSVDSFKLVLDDLRRKNLIVREFSYMSYTLSEIKPANTDSGSLNINYTYFPSDKMFDLNGKKVAAIWAGDISTKNIFLATGKYKLTVLSMGTPVAGIFPHLNVLINNNKIAEFSTPADYSSFEIPFDQKADGDIIIRLVMDNDAVDETKKEDRNAFIYSIRISRIKE